MVELVILVDGSDSYNNKSTVLIKKHFKFYYHFKVGSSGGKTFEKTLDVVCDLVSGIKDEERAVVSVVQFSGVKKLEGSYVPGRIFRQT